MVVQYPIGGLKDSNLGIRAAAYRGDKGCEHLFSLYSDIPIEVQKVIFFSQSALSGFSRTKGMGFRFVERECCVMTPNTPAKEIKVEWYPIYGPKILFEFGEERPIVCYCTHEQKMNFEGFTQNGCYGNQPKPFEVVFYSIDANTSCSFTKQDLTVKQAHRASFCFVL